MNGDIASTLAWSNDGRTLAIGTTAGSIGLYDASTFTTVGSREVVTSGYVQSASFSPDDRSLVIGGTDGAIDILGLPDLARVGERLVLGNSAGNGGVWAWYTPSGDIQGLAEDPRPANGDLQRWFRLTAAPTELAAIACRLAAADMTAAQWTQLVGDQPYRHVCPARG